MTPRDQKDVTERKVRKEDMPVLNGVDTAQLQELIDKIEADPDMAQCTFRVANSWEDGAHNKSRIKEFYAAKAEDSTRSAAFTYDLDEPPVLAGDNRGANPTEMALTSLAGCMTTTIVYYAALMGVEVEKCKIEAEGDIDLHGMFNLDPDISPAFQQIRVVVDLETSGTHEEEDALVEMGKKYSPVYSTFKYAVDMDTHRGAV